MRKQAGLAFAMLYLVVAGAALAAGPVPNAFREAVGIQQSNTFNRNAVTAFVYNTFYMFDKHVPADEFLGILTDKGLNMRFPEATLTSHEDFKRWYAGIGENIKSNTHAIQSVDVAVAGNGLYRAHVVVLWQAENKKGEYLKFKADQRWTLVEDQGRLKIKDYIVKAAR